MKEILKGDINNGEKFDLLFLGGVLENQAAQDFLNDEATKKFENVQKESLPTKVVNVFDGFENANIGDEYLLFLDKDSNGNWNLVSFWQGQYRVKDGKTYDFVTMDTKEKNYNVDIDSFIKNIS